MPQVKLTQMQLRKNYNGLNPQLLYDEIKDFALKQGVILGESKMETYSLPEDSSSFISRGTLIFHTPENKGKECLRAHVVGSARGETRMMLDIDEVAFPQEKIAALQDDLDFIFKGYEPDSNA